MCILTEYCPKGSLQDVLENDQIKLDWIFKFSLIQDICRVWSLLYILLWTCEIFRAWFICIPILDPMGIWRVPIVWLIQDSLWKSQILVFRNCAEVKITWWRIIHTPIIEVKRILKSTRMFNYNFRSVMDCSGNLTKFNRISRWFRKRRRV